MLGGHRRAFAMAKQVAIINHADASFRMDRYERKYFRYLEPIQENGGDIIDALRAKDISRIENVMRNLADSVNKHILIMGMVCVIIDREELYVDAGYKSYLEYAVNLYEKIGVSVQTVSAAKIIIERYIDYNSDLNKYGFKIERNSNKLLLLELAIKNHQSKPDIFRHICNDSFREFKAYAKTPDNYKSLPAPVPQIKIKNGKIFINGKNILNIPDELPVEIKETIGRDLIDVYSIRSAGNEPIIIEAYDEREARILKNKTTEFLKEIRSKR
jgi:hypothetical protein